MAMTKKEAEAVRLALEKARILGALRFTSPVECDVPRPGHEPGAPKQTQGFDFNAYGKRVWIGWSTSVSHGEGVIDPDGNSRSGSKNGRDMFSSKLLALKAMRCQLEQEYAKSLAKIDALIESEQSA